MTREGDRQLEGSTRERLLDAAERLFAETGYRRASVRSITAAAGCNVASVNYHFGGKAGLYREVLRRRLGAMRERRLAALAAARPDDLAGTLAAFADAFLAPLQEGAEGRLTLQLIAREMADPQLPPGLFRDQLVVPVSQALAAAMAAAAPHLPERTVRLCVQSFVGQLLHVVHAHQFAAIKAAAPLPPPAVAELAAHIVRFTVAAVERLHEEARRGAARDPRPNREGKA